MTGKLLLRAAGLALLYGFANAQQTAVPLLPEPSDPAAKELREKRNRMFTSLAHTGIPTVEQTPVGAPPTFVSVNIPLMSPLPFSESDTVVVGYVKAAQPFLSQDHKMIYTELSLVVSDVVKAPAGAIKSSREIAVAEMGGSLILPSGRTVTVEFRGRGAPIEVGQRYALFLLYSPIPDCFRVVKAWSLKDGKAWAMSPGDVARKTSYNGMEEPAFLKAMKESVAKN